MLYLQVARVHTHSHDKSATLPFVRINTHLSGGATGTLLLASDWSRFIIGVERILLDLLSVRARFARFLTIRDVVDTTVSGAVQLRIV
jgi:hypothetical protein